MLEIFKLFGKKEEVSKFPLKLLKGWKLKCWKFSNDLEKVSNIPLKSTKQKFVIGISKFPSPSVQKISLNSVENCFSFLFAARLPCCVMESKPLYIFSRAFKCLWHLTFMKFSLLFTQLFSYLIFLFWGFLLLNGNNGLKTFSRDKLSCR